MNCDGVRGLLSAYVDGELSAGELLRVEQHLRRCHACADEVDSLRQTIALVASLDEVEVPASFQAQLHERLVGLGPPVAKPRRTQSAPASQRGIRRWAMPAAAAAAVIAIGFTTLQQVKEIGPGVVADVLFPTELAQKPTTVVQNAPLAGNAGGGTDSNNGKNSTTTNPSQPGPGGANSNLPVNQPPGVTGTRVSENTSSVVTHNPTNPEETKAQSRTTYTVRMSLSVSTAGAKQALLGLGSAQEMHDGSIRITVPAAELARTQERIRAVSGLTLVGQPQTSSYDYAVDLRDAAARQAHWQSRVDSLKRQLDAMSANAPERQSAQLELAEAQRQLANARDGLVNLEAMADKAIFEIRLQAAVQ